MEMPGRTGMMDRYRFGFNGKENDREWGTAGLTQDYGMRLYNPAVGRFLSVDPLAPDYPNWSPYPFAMNRPVDGIDLDGLEWTLPWYLRAPIWRPLMTLPRITLPIPPKLPAPPVIIDPSTEQIFPYPNTLPKPVNSQSIDWVNNPPKSPSNLGSDWEETTHKDNNSGSRDFKNKKTDEKVRWDPGKKGKPGWEGKDHWHRHNPNKTGKGDAYLDKLGNAVPRGSGPSHIGTKSLLKVIPDMIDDYQKSLRNLDEQRKKLNIWNWNHWNKINSISEQKSKIKQSIYELKKYKKEREEYEKKLKEYYEECDCIL